MKGTTKTLILFLSTIIFLGCAPANTLTGIQIQAKDYSNLIKKADVIHLSESVIVEHSSGYQAKWNSVSSTPVK